MEEVWQPLFRISSNFAISQLVRLLCLYHDESQLPESGVYRKSRYYGFVFAFLSAFCDFSRFLISPILRKMYKLVSVARSTLGNVTSASKCVADIQNILEVTPRLAPVLTSQFHATPTLDRISSGRHFPSKNPGGLLSVDNRYTGVVAIILVTIRNGTQMFDIVAFIFLTIASS